MPRSIQVAVVGSSEPDAELAEMAEEVGRRLGLAGATVVCGGLGGVMAAACRGISATGGLSVGLLPGSDREAANPWVQVAIATGLGELRNALIVRTADVVIAVGGEYGTLSELAFALKFGRPVVGLDTWQLRRPSGPVDAGVTVVQDPQSAVTLALELAARVPADGARRD